MEPGYRVVLDAQPDEVWGTIACIGGRIGWYSSRFMWALRGIIDRLVDGMDLWRGRPDPVRLRPGDPVDFFRVLEVREAKQLSLVAEIKFPGEATLEFRFFLSRKGRRSSSSSPDFCPKGFQAWFTGITCTHFTSTSSRRR